MIAFSNCKINLGLTITGKRSDGYHNIETVFYPIALTDALEIIENKNTTQEDIIYTSSGITVLGKVENNLCIKAYHLLKKDFPALPPISMHLHKTIPIGAGLAGGSSNGAFALKLLNEKFSLELSTQQLINYALQLGSDCPFFILNKPCMAKGRGEIMNPIELDLSNYAVVIVNPGIHVNTGWAFTQLQLNNSTKNNSVSIDEIIKKPIDEWKVLLKNDFEKPVFLLYPEIKSIKEKLYDCGALYASMTGSGSTVFGIFSLKEKPTLDFPSNYFVKTI